MSANSLCKQLDNKNNNQCERREKKQKLELYVPVGTTKTLNLYQVVHTPEYDVFHCEGRHFGLVDVGTTRREEQCVRYKIDADKKKRKYEVEDGGDGSLSGSPEESRGAEHT